MKKLSLFLACAFFSLILSAQTADTNEASVERALLDYIEGFYEGDTAKIIRGVLPDVHKYGYWKNKETGEYGGEPMSFTEMKAYAKRVKEKGKFAKPDAPKKVEIFDIQDQTASGKVTAWWGTDYILLGKYKGDWKIVHVLWQGPLKS